MSCTGFYLSLMISELNSTECGHEVQIPKFELLHIFI